MENIGAEAAKLAGLQIDQLQKVRGGNMTLGHIEWFNNLSKERRDELSGASSKSVQDVSMPVVEVVPDKFRLMREIVFTVPVNFGHSICLTKFKDEHGLEFNDVTDENFAGVSHRLLPGKKYRAKIFEPTVPRYESEDAMAFLKDQPNSLLVGAQGLSVVWPYVKEDFPKGKALISFDEKEKLWAGSGGYRRVPYADRGRDGDWGWGLGCFEFGWNGDGCLLCVCDEPSES